jgi:hypothetical protein
MSTELKQEIMKLFYTMFGMLFAFTSCKKEESAKVISSDVRLVNTAVGVAVKVNPGNNFFYSKQTAVPYGGNMLYMVERKSIAFKVVNAADTLVNFYDNTINLNYGIYSMFIAGQGTQIEAIVKEETDFPFINNMDKIIVKADSIVSVRFINLSPNSVPVKIKIATAASNEVDNLPYKTIGNWKKYTATTASTVYTFQVRDAATDALLTTFNFTANAANRFKNVSLIIKGLQGTATGVNAYGIFAVNHF